MKMDLYTPLSQALWAYLEQYGGMSDLTDEAHDRIMSDIDEATITLEVGDEVA